MGAHLICKDCKYYSKGENMSLCKRNDSWEITEPDNKCRFLPEMTELTCGDCWCLKHDMGCFGCSSGDSAYINGKLCYDFTDLRESLDFSYFAVEIKGKQLTEKQHNAKERALVNLILSETPEHVARLRELLDYR